MTDPTDAIRQADAKYVLEWCYQSPSVPSNIHDLAARALDQPSLAHGFAGRPSQRAEHNADPAARHTVSEDDHIADAANQASHSADVEKDLPRVGTVWLNIPSERFVRVLSVVKCNFGFDVMVEDCIYSDEIAVFSHTEFGRLHNPNTLHDSDTVIIPRDLARQLVEVLEFGSFRRTTVEPGVGEVINTHAEIKAEAALSKLRELFSD